MIRLILTIALLLCSETALAIDGEKPVDFSADELTYNRELNLITARGNVTFVQDGSTLKADHVNFSPADNVVIASGNVEIYTPTAD